MTVMLTSEPAQQSLVMVPPAVVSVIIASSQQQIILQVFHVLVFVCVRVRERACVWIGSHVAQDGIKLTM